MAYPKPVVEHCGITMAPLFVSADSTPVVSPIAAGQTKTLTIPASALRVTFNATGAGTAATIALTGKSGAIELAPGDGHLTIDVNGGTEHAASFAVVTPANTKLGFFFHCDTVDGA